MTDQYIVFYYNSLYKIHHSYKLTRRNKIYEFTAKWVGIKIAGFIKVYSTLLAKILATNTLPVAHWNKPKAGTKLLFHSEYCSLATSSLLFVAVINP